MEYITIIISTGIFSIIVTFFTNVWLSNNEYKKEYYKKIIEKRIEAYDNLENFNRILNLHILTDDSKGAYLTATSDIDTWNNLNEANFLTIMFLRWYSKETQGFIQSISTILAKIGTNLPQNFTGADLEKQASDYLPELIYLRRQLSDSTTLDFYNLHDVNAFYSQTKQTIKQKQSQRQKPPKAL